MPATAEILRGLSDVSGVPTDRLTTDTALEDLGLDSFDLVELGHLFQDRFGVARDTLKGATTVAEVLAQVADVQLKDETAEDLLRLEWIPPEARAPVAAREVVFAEAFTVRDALAWVQDWLVEPRDDVLAFVTHGAVATVAGEDVTDLAGSAVWGLIRSAQTEHPGRFALVDGDADASVAALIAAGEEQLALRDGAPLVPVLAYARAEAQPTRLDPDGTVLITGGSGRRGVLLAGHLARVHGVRRLVLASRRGGPVPAGIDAEVTVVACDVTDRDAVEALLAEHQPTTIVHAAGVQEPATLEAMSPEQLERVLRAKVEGAALLDELATPDLFISFSSVAGTLGGPGLAAEAAANAWLDGLAHHRRATGRHGLSLAWGLWSTGLTSGLTDSDRARLARSGLAPLDVEQAFALFDAALRSPEPVAYPVRFELAGLREAPPVLQRLAPDVPVRQRPAALDLANLDLPKLVVTNAAFVLGHNQPGLIRLEHSFESLGFDSLTAVELRNRLGAATGLWLPATVLFDYPTPAAVVALLREHFAPEPEPAVAPVDDLSARIDSLTADELFALIDNELAA